MAESKKTVEIHYIKSAQMNTVYADGAYGGVSPRGLINFALYNERNPIPRVQEVDVVEGKIVDSRVTESRAGLVREIECEVFMTPEAALSLGHFLVERATLALSEGSEAKEER